jgi:hypothetical protein
MVASALSAINTNANGVSKYDRVTEIQLESQRDTGGVRVSHRSFQPSGIETQGGGAWRPSVLPHAARQRPKPDAIADKSLMH